MKAWVRRATTAYCRSAFEAFEDRIEPEAGVGPNPEFSDVRRYIREAGVQQFETTIPCAGVASAQFGVPQIGGVGLDAQQRVVRAFATITGIVADLSIFLTPEHSDDTTVKIKDQARPVVG